MVNIGELLGRGEIANLFSEAVEEGEVYRLRLSSAEGVVAKKKGDDGRKKYFIVVGKDQEGNAIGFQEKEVVGKLFPTCEKISIDYAVMEKSKEIYTLPAEFGWSDLGSWGSLRTLLPQDEAGNAKVGKDIRLYECKNCVVHAADESKLVVQGLEGYIVAEKHGQLLVCSLKEEQRIKEFGK